MRERTLHNSVAGLLGDDERLQLVVHMWRRRPYSLIVMAISGLVVFGLAAVFGVEEPAGRLGLALAAVVVIGLGTTEYRILAETSAGLVLFRSSKVRQRATAVVERLPASTPIQPVGSNLVITDWEVDGTVYSVMKRFQNAMMKIAEE